MKQHCVILIALTILSSITFGQVSQDAVHYFSDLFPKNGLFIRPDSLSDGTWIAFCETNKDQIGLKLHYKNGYLNGESISFWPNGNIQQKGFYKDGCLIGLNEKWFENGIKESESNCEVDNIQLQHSLCHIINYWSKTGTQLIKDGTGKYISYHDNDTLQVVGEYHNSERVGKWIWYYGNSNIQTVEYYIQGKHDGEFITYYINGQKRIQGQYAKGKQVGIWEHWYMDGKNEEYESRVDGKRDSVYKYWHRNGQLSTLGNYKSGMEEGIWKHWDDKGKLETEEKYIDGKLVEKKNYR
jgi:antitoxin component YwqK of YwqJK toxin-antitoxin module